MCLARGALPLSSLAFGITSRSFQVESVPSSLVCCETSGLADEKAPCRMAVGPAMSSARLVAFGMSVAVFGMPTGIDTRVSLLTTYGSPPLSLSAFVVPP